MLLVHGSGELIQTLLIAYMGTAGNKDGAQHLPMRKPNAASCCPIARKGRARPLWEDNKGYNFDTAHKTEREVLFMANLHKIFVNLPVDDLPRSMAFFRALGYTFNPQFTDENAACLVLGDDIYVMLLVKPFFKGFITTEVAQAKQASEMIIALSADSRDAVDTLVGKALSNGGSSSTQLQDLGYMYSRSFLDPDCHHWEVLYMDPSHVQ